MFNIQHILYMVVSGLFTMGLLILFAVKVKDESHKNLILKISAISTAILHYSDIWVNFFATGGNVQVQSVHILPVYPCNVVMWFLLICALMKKKGVLFTLLSEFCFCVGVICGVIGIVLNANFDATPTLADYDVLKGLLSHSTMVFGCIYLKVAGYVKIRVFNAVSATFGFGTFVLCGYFVNRLYARFGMTSPDGMFLKSNPYFSVPTILLGVLVVLIMFGGLALYELSFPKEERWYNKLKIFMNKAKNTLEKGL